MTARDTPYGGGEPRVVKMLERLKGDAVMSKFATARECDSYRSAVEDMLRMLRAVPMLSIYERATPRTDEQVTATNRKIELIGCGSDGGLGPVDAVTAEFARRLEQELETVRDAHMANCLAADTLRTETRELRARLEEQRYADIEHETMGCHVAKTGIYATPEGK